MNIKTQFFNLKSFPFNLAGECQELHCSQTLLLYHLSLNQFSNESFSIKLTPISTLTSDHPFNYICCKEFMIKYTNASH